MGFHRSSSSLGTFLTGKTYTGSHGNSLELIGLDPGVNDKAMGRRIVMHPADYVSAGFRAVRAGRGGRSWGCPALDPTVAPAIIACIRNGSLVYVGGPAPAWVAVDEPSAPRRTPATSKRTTSGLAERVDSQHRMNRQDADRIGFETPPPASLGLLRVDPNNAAIAGRPPEPSLL